MKKNQISTVLQWTRYGFYFNALVWLLFGVLSLFSALEVSTLLRWIYTALMVINAAVMLWFGQRIVSGQKGIFFLAILYMAVNVVLTITDQFGAVDALILFLHLSLLGLLVITRLILNQVQR